MAFWKATWLQIASTWRKWKCKKYGSLAVGHARSNLPSIVHAWWQHARCLLDRRSQWTGLFLCDSSPPPGQRWPKSMFSFSPALPTISQNVAGTAGTPLPQIPVPLLIQLPCWAHWFSSHTSTALYPPTCSPASLYTSLQHIHL